MVERIERWLPVPRWEGLYDASCLGRIRNAKTGKILKPWPTRGGYVKVDFYRDGKRTPVTVHQIVALTFIGPRSEGQQVRHYINPDRTKNAAWNLRYGTCADQHEDKRRHGTVPRERRRPEYCRKGLHPYARGGCKECALDTDRAWRARQPKRPRLRKTHCKYGHEFTPGNTRTNPSTGARACLTCYPRKNPPYDAGIVCKRGHERTVENTYVRPNGVAECKICRRMLVAGTADRDNIRLRTFRHAGHPMVIHP